MTIRKLLMPLVAQTLTSDTARNFKRSAIELRRWVNSAPHTITFYHRIDDPYSLLLLQAIPKLLNQFKVNLEIKTILANPSDLIPKPKPKPKILAQYSEIDANRLARFHQLRYPEKALRPNAEDCLMASGILLNQEGKSNLLHMALEITEAAWQFGTTTLSSCAKRYGSLDANTTIQIANSNQQQLAERGHYQSGMLYYNGEWYWGVDRLFNLADRLNQLKLNKSEVDWTPFTKQYENYYDHYNRLKRRPKHKKTLDFYYSFRSPYSYIALKRTFKLCDHYKIPLNIKPVLPMVMRGLPVPKEKRMYILLDAKREADKHGIPFGRICDPVGTGVERCLALYSYAKAQGKEREYLLSVGHGTWAEGVDVANNGLGKLVERAGLDWKHAKAILSPDHPEFNQWKNMVEQNQQELAELGLWGVPSYQYGDLLFWGQDRLWAIEQAINESNTPSTESAN